MRTTVSLDDDIVPSVKRFAEERDLSLGEAISQLIRRALHAPIQTIEKNGFHVLVLPPGSPTITNEQIRKLLDELH
jgi:hypothetical protein